MGVTDVRSSPTGFPFKVARLEGTLSEPDVYAARERLCDLGYLRTPYQRKGGDLADTEGRRCLCNSLTADVGLGQTRPDGYQEPGLVTLGSDLSGPRRLLERHPEGWTAAQAVAWLEGPVFTRSSAERVPTGILGP